MKRRNYRYTQGEYEYDETPPDAGDASCPNATECVSARPPLDMPMARSSHIDSEYTNESISPKVINGVKMGEGDGTVNLLSLGAMCVEGWKRKRWNPAGMRVTTVEVRATVVDTLFLILTRLLCEASPQSSADDTSRGRNDERSCRHPGLDRAE